MIKVYNTMTLIENYETNTRLERALSVFDIVAHKTTFKAFRKFTKKGITYMVIPKSYPIKWLLEYYPNEEVVYFNRKETTDIFVKGIEALYDPRDFKQRKALKWLDESYQYPQKLISLKPGDGKTYIALKYICDEKRKALIVVHSNDVMKQWKQRVTELTNIPKEQICTIAGHDSLLKAMEFHEKYTIFIAIHKTLHFAIQEDNKIVERFRRAAGIGIKVIDEAHLELSSTIAIDLNSNFTDNLYLTATPERTEFKQNRLYKLVLPVYFAFDLGNSEDTMKRQDKYHICYFINYDLRCLYSEVQSMITMRGFNMNKWAEWTVEKARIGNMVDAFMWAYNKATKKLEGKIDQEPICAILLKSLEQCKLFEKELIRRGIKQEDIGQFNGLRTKAKKMQELNHKYIISTEKSYGNAIDIRLDIMMDFIPYMSGPTTWQIVGRLREGYGGLYFSFHDISNFKCVESKKCKMRELKPRAAAIIEMNY